jgi:hypothetical protein
MELPHPPLFTKKKNPFEKEEKILALRLLFLKLHLQLVILSI